MKYPVHRSLRRFLVVWSSAIAVAFLLMSMDAGIAFYRLDKVVHDEMRDALRLQFLHEFEVAALEANREPVKANWQPADTALAHLQREEPQQKQQLAFIIKSYGRLKMEYNPKASWSDEHEFLDSARDFRTSQLSQIQSMTRQSSQIDRWSRLPLLVISCFALLGLVAGGSVLWKRVFEPTLLIASAARSFGAGVLSARVGIKREDELGELGATFNAMASAIETREHERLRFVAAVAHDLKNPLVVVGGVAAMMRDKPDKFSNEERNEWLDKIARNARSMEAMIFDFTDAVQAQTGSLHLTVNMCDIAALLRECVSKTAMSFPHHKVFFDGPQALEACIDRARIERVVYNLLSNAAKYSARGTTVTAHLETRGANAIIEVRDQGVGMSANDLKRLFTPFMRLESTSNMSSGTGLGLSTVKKIVEAHDGKIEVESEVGVGSNFRALLPLQSRPRTESTST